MKHVIQKDPNGCAPATIAILTGKSYKYCKTLFPNKRQWKTYGTTLGQLELVLRRLGLKVSFQKTLPRSKNAIIAVTDESFSNKIWHGKHVVVWDGKRKRFIDPYVGSGLNDAGSLKHLSPNTYKRAMFIVLAIQ